ncbi:MAG: hypothetical protein ACC612_08340 [Methanomethylovorans sp.]|uniref:hypothetical protein n=1 Tax=Methanomethylovorans sp. TaxID=2758717 RepID=UPI0035315202
MKRFNLFIVLFILALSVYVSGCSSQEPAGAVNETIIGFLNAVNAGNCDEAFYMYEGKDFLAPASIELSFKNKGFSKGSLKDVAITSEEHTDLIAIATAECTVSKIDEDGNVIEGKNLPIYFKLQNSELGWIIIRVSFNTPLELSEDDLVTIEVQETAVDPITQNSVPITIFAGLLFGSGIYLNRKEKQNKMKSSKTVDVTNATPMAKESLAQFIRIVPSQQVVAGGKATVDVWVKNFSQQPYEHFAVKAKFPNTVDFKDLSVFFDTIAPGQAAKQSWTFVAKAPGWLGIEEPTIVFEYLGTKYAGTLDTVWVPVQ